jgi:hypothetical protein
MTKIRYSNLPCVTATINYIDKDVESPEFYLFDPSDGVRPLPPKADKRDMSIHDVRECMNLMSLDRNGFSFTTQNLRKLNYENPQTMQNSYYPLCAELVKSETNCKEVFAFDHNVRETGPRNDGIYPPARNAHNDYTNESGPRRVRDLMGQRAEELLCQRYAFINVWRPLRGPVDTQPLAICDATTISLDDFVSADLRLPDRTGKILSVRYNERHRWCYLGNMQDNEIILLKCFDTAGDNIAKYTAHSSFYEPNQQQEDLKGRKSIEVRTIAFF